MTASQKRIDELEAAILHHKRLYYTGRAEISDAEYDALEDALRALAPDSPVLSTVGFSVDAEDKIAHRTPMLSLDKRRTPAEIRSWAAGRPCVVSDKMDGSSASLVYVDGVFRLAKTRGDGAVGENITAHLWHVDVPRRLPVGKGETEVRGELCISSQDFAALADEMARRGGERPKSIRNIVAGLLHKKEDLDLCRYLTFFAYELLGDTVSVATESDKFTWLAGAGFAVPHWERVDPERDLDRVLDAYTRRYADSTWLSDGLVFAIDDLEIQRSMGNTAHHPRGKMAFKFASEEAETTIRDIALDVSRTGRITFVGIVDPVSLSGATVRRVTLNNRRYVAEHQLGPGARIVITRSGEVIPKHVRTIVPAPRVAFPHECPACGGPLEVTASEVDLVCRNTACPGRTKSRIAHWVATCGIDQLGEATLEALWEAGIVRDVPDLYRLTQQDIAALDRHGDQSAANIVAAIDQTRNLDLATFLAASGIEGLGPQVAKNLVRRLKSWEALCAADAAALREIDGIGDVLAASIAQGVQDVARPLRTALEQVGVHIRDPESAAAGPLEGTSFVLTGALSRPRNAVVADIEAAGGKVTGQVSSRTTYLVCNQPSNSSKFRKARDLGIRVIDETQLTALLSGQPLPEK